MLAKDVYDRNDGPPIEDCLRSWCQHASMRLSEASLLFVPVRCSRHVSKHREVGQCDAYSCSVL